MTATNKDVVLVVSLVLSLVSLVLLFGVTWYFQSSLDLLQQQVEYDRELLLKLQEHVELKTYVDNTDVTKRQSRDDCQYKDGTPGPRGPPGPKGDEGKQGRKGDIGPRGDAGERGPRGEIGDQGYPGPMGERGEKGDQGDRGQKGSSGVAGLTGPKGNDGTKGQRGDPGERGRRGLLGDTGSRGPAGETGKPGRKGDNGAQGLPGEKGEPGPSGLKGEMGYQGNKGEKGSSGLPGPTGLTGPKGATGQKGVKGVKGDKEERNGGTVYVRWGHDQCPSTAQLVYSGRAGGSWYDQGGGANPQCLPMDPNYLKSISGNQHWRAHMYGAEYETVTDSSSHLHGRHNTDVPCAVCYVTQRSTVYMLPAKYTCPSGWIREYYGYLMADYFGRGVRNEFTCIDTALKPVPGSAANKDGLVFYFTEGKCGSLPCPPYDNNRELSCAVCTK